MKNNKPVVSVIMSVYNAESYLDKAIKSILNQTYKLLELIIINDGSTDKSLDIIISYLKIDDRIVFINQQNMGLTKSLNKAIKISKGAYIARQDADDESKSNRIEQQLKLLKSNDLDFVVARAIKNGNIVPKRFLLNFNKEIIFKTGNIFIHGTFFGKKSIFQNIKYNESYKYTQDFKFILDCFSKNVKIGYIEEALYILNDIETNISNTKKEEQMGYLSSSLIEYFGNDRYFRFINNFKGKYRHTIKLILLIILEISGEKIAFKVIK